MQSVHIANKIASSIHTHSEVYSIQHYVINFITALLYDYCIPCVFILFTKQKATTSNAHEKKSNNSIYSIQLDTRFSATNNSKPWRTVISYIQPFRLDVPTFKYMMFYFNISVGVDLHISIGHISTILCRCFIVKTLVIIKMLLLVTH
jgi:hypothetical protein